MDEATSSVDEKTDIILQSIIRKKLKGKTIITIAHKLTNILDYDQIIVLEDGTIAEQGISKDLFKSKGLFYEMMALDEEWLKSEGGSANQKSPKASFTK